MTLKLKESEIIQIKSEKTELENTNIELKRELDSKNMKIHSLNGEIDELFAKK